VKQSDTILVSSSDVPFYPERRLGLDDAGAQQESLDHYSYDEANSHKPCVDQGDCLEIKLKSGLNLFDLIKF